LTVEAFNFHQRPGYRVIKAPQVVQSAAHRPTIFIVSRERRKNMNDSSENEQSAGHTGRRDPSASAH
jgi:hypothetical protein